MKIAITTTGADIDAPIDPRFGRTARFLIYDTETQQAVIIDNTPNMNAAQGAGIQSAERVSRENVEVLISGHCGPKAHRVLKAAGIKIYQTDRVSGREALQRYLDGKLTESNEADVEGHWV